MTTHLVIGDPHCTPSASNERFTWAGRMARDLKVDKVICMGDFAYLEDLFFKALCNFCIPIAIPEQTKNKFTR